MIASPTCNRPERITRAYQPLRPNIDLMNSPALWERPPNSTLNASNGLLDVESGELRDHDPDFR